MTNTYRDEEETSWAKSFGQNLQTVIKNKNVTQQQLARKLGITDAMLSRYVHGISVPSTFKTCQIASALDCDITDLIKQTYED